ncbi:Uncharacterized conserved protein, DUF1330 family [Streptomyces zhaozhouensis]|uniref:Uncharacterized conserved protein, DUF1330 family n=1 Tax=Streptomyces zhaozhouensis TaxID=1300267 RepID=A0A286DTU4_9ACTN|nr:DUF1330 domain-containing protein [Streptomyces zhaozhouensis]SOD62075.1 Uncharacterized conserved protein, DUF1330 family [Streptomyces zhaozhouensis]
MTAYAVAQLLPGVQHPDVAEYIERIQGTMEPFGGRFLVHNAPHETVEGTWEGHVVIVGFPSMDAARAWYASDAYQEILPLRTDHIAGNLLLVPGVPEDYDAAPAAARLRAELAAEPA